MFRRRKRPDEPTDGPPDEPNEPEANEPGLPLRAAAPVREPAREPARPVNPMTPVTVPSAASLTRAEPPRRPTDYGAGPTTPPRRPPPGTPPQRNDTAPEGKRLTVGRDITMAGSIAACDVLIVEGRVEAVMEEAKLMEIAESGVYVGRAVVELAEIAGRFEGDLIVRDRLLVRATGRVGGNIRYARLEVELGGELSGTLIAGLETPLPPATLPPGE